MRFTRGRFDAPQVDDKKSEEKPEKLDADKSESDGAEAKATNNSTTAAKAEKSGEL